MTKKKDDGKTPKKGKTTKKGKGTDIQEGVTSLISLGHAELFNAPVEDLNPEQTAVAWAVIDAMETVFSGRKTELRAGLLETVQKIGDEVENGHFIANIEGNEVKRERRQGKSPEDKAFRLLLKELEIPLTDCYSEETVYKLDPSKVQFHIDGGRIPEERVAELKKVTFALKVKANQDLSAELDRVSERFKKLKKARLKK